MPEILVVATLPHLDGYARDDVKNTFAFETVDSGDVQEVMEAVRDFYIVDPGAGQTIGGILSGTRTRVANACFVEAFDISGHLDGSPHGSAIDSLNFTLTAAGGESNLPSEVAICLSTRSFDFDTVAESGPVAALPTPSRAQEMGAPATYSGRTKPRSRRRGRVYIGPLRNSALTQDLADGRARVSDAARNIISGAADDLAHPAGSVSWNWCVWSRRNAALHQISTGFVDDAFDIQRRRGEDAILRTNWS